MSPASPTASPGLQPTWIVGVTGHRQLGDPGLIAARVREALARLRERLPATASLQLFSSLAAGADLLLARLAAEEQLPTHVVLPLPWDEFTKDLDEAALAEAGAALARARSSRVAPGNAPRPGCYADANTELVLLSDVLLAIWDGEPTRGVGGTAEVVTQARAIGRPLVWIHSGTGEVTYERLERLDREGDETLLTGAQRHLDEPGGDGNLGTGVRRNLWRGLRVGVAASVIGAAAAALGNNDNHLAPNLVWFALLGAQSALAGWLLFERSFGSHSATFQGWLARRFAVEVLTGLRASAGLVDPLEPVAGSMEPSWRRFAVSASTATHAALPANETWQARRDRYVNERLLGPRGQIGYFEKEGARATESSLRQAGVTRIATAASLLASVLSLLWKGGHLILHFAGVPSPVEAIPLVQLLVRFFPAALPAVATGLLSVEFLFDRKRRSTRYPQLAARLKTLGDLLAAQTSEQGARRLVHTAERLLMTELIEWRASEERASGKLLQRSVSLSEREKLRAR